MRYLSFLALLTTLVMMTSCRAINGPSGDDSVTIELLEHDFVFIEGADAWLVFANPIADSRCPADVECITQGSASIEMRLTRSSSQTFFVLEGFVGPIGSEPATGISEDVDGVVVSLLNLDPYPVDSISSNELYRAVLRVDY